MAHVMAGEWVEDTQDMAQEAMTYDEIRDYCMDYMDPELHTWSELEHQIGRTLSAQGHGIDACQNERERAGWMEAEQDADQDAREPWTDNFDPEQLADAEQHVRDVADMQDRQHNYSYFHAV